MSDRYLIVDSLNGDLTGDLTSDTPGKAVQAVDNGSGKPPRFYVERARHEVDGGAGYHVYRVNIRELTYDYTQIVDLEYMLDKDCQYITSFTYLERG